MFVQLQLKKNFFKVNNFLPKLMNYLVRLLGKAWSFLVFFEIVFGLPALRLQCRSLCSTNISVVVID